MSMEVTLIDHMGTDLTVVNAARVSMDKESEWDQVSFDFHTEPVLCDKDIKLIHYLVRHNHWTPFGHCFAQFRIKAPIFVARQLAKHQVGLVWNEVSRRYVDSPPEFYEPEWWRGRADNVKQGSSRDVVCSGWNDLYRDAYYTCYGLYRGMITNGVCPEQARMVLPQSMMTEWYWSGSLAAWARVCKLRLDLHSQLETQEIAQDLADHLADLFPVSWSALLEQKEA